MVKRLRICIRCVKFTLLLLMALLIWGAIWLQAAERSLEFARPWILAAMNPEGAPFGATFDKVTIDWRNLTEFGKIHITKVNFKRSDGTSFAQFPDVYATIDPLGFLPRRSMIHGVILRGPKLSMTKGSDGNILVGLDDTGATPVALSEVLAPFSTAAAADAVDQPVRMPFRNFVIDKATVTFIDEKTGARLESKQFSLSIARRFGRYRAKLSAPFSYQKESGMITASLRATANREQYALTVEMKQFPGELVCMSGGCPEGVAFKGVIAGKVVLRLAPSAALNAIAAQVTTDDAQMTAPEWFAEPVKLGKGTVVNATYDQEIGTATLTDTRLKLQDTVVVAEITARHAPDGWYAEVTGETTERLDVTKLYKYWPLTMAPDSRDWVTSKLKSGTALGTLVMHLTPEALAMEDLPDEAVSADVKAFDVTLDYLPGFPNLQHVDGDIHFTGRTAKILTRGGTMLDGTVVKKASLWCPDLINPRTPMETVLNLDAPMKDVATLLALPSFTFDDETKLDPAKVMGHAAMEIALKFDAFSERANVDPNLIYLDAVDYTITANLSGVGQSGLFDSYRVREVNGELKADGKGESFNGSLGFEAMPISDVKLAHKNDGPLTLEVKTPAPKLEPGKPVEVLPGNDFSLSYQKVKDVPNVTITGKRFVLAEADKPAEVKAAEKKVEAKAMEPAQPKNEVPTKSNDLLKDFPALLLKIDLESLMLTPDAALTNVKGTLDCAADRCESAELTASTGTGKLEAAIRREQGERQLIASASNAGELLRALDVTNRMAGGTLSLRGSYDDSKQPPTFTGRVTIDEFAVKNSQILGRIFSIGSLTGLANALTGSGISFDKLSANLAAREGVVTVTEGKANGTAMGITIAGTVDTTSSSLALKGVVVPAYALNSIIGKIPIVGAIAGGDGEGLIAFNYSVSGTYLNAEVGVNPLSGLTPGFLRGIFGVFDQGGAPKSEKKSGNKKEQKMPETHAPQPILDRGQPEPTHSNVNRP